MSYVHYMDWHPLVLVKYSFLDWQLADFVICFKGFLLQMKVEEVRRMAGFAV